MYENLVVSDCGDTRLFYSVRKSSGVRTVVTQGCFIMYQNLGVSDFSNTSLSFCLLNKWSMW